MSNELKPCPFCGSRAIGITCDEPFFYARCQNCYAVGHDRFGEDLAAKSWNTRYTPKEDKTDE